MKWTGKFSVDGDTRVRTFFALFPVTIHNMEQHTYETRWLTSITVEEKFRVVTGDCWWEKLRFIDSIYM